MIEEMRQTTFFTFCPGHCLIDESKKFSRKNNRSIIWMYHEFGSKLTADFVPPLHYKFGPNEFIL